MQHAWLTPDLSVLTSTSEDCRFIKVEPNLWTFISGAISELGKVWNWEQSGTATPQETADYFLEKWGDFVSSDCHYIGECRAFAFTPAPAKWLNFGSTVAVASYPELAAVVPAGWIIGANISLPPQAGRTMLGFGSLSGFPFNLGVGGGQRTVTLTTAEMPAHTHSELIPVNTPNLSGIEAPAIAATIGSAVTGSTGGGAAHNNMPPYNCINWAIYAGR